MSELQLWPLPVTSIVLSLCKKRKKEEGEERTKRRWEGRQGTHLPLTRCRPQDNWESAFGTIIELPLEAITHPYPKQSIRHTSLILYQPVVAWVGFLSFSQELSFMDFPSSKGFCCTTGQVRPLHAWLQRTAAQPRQLQPGGTKVRSHCKDSQS